MAHRINEGRETGGDERKVERRVSYAIERHDDGGVELCLKSFLVGALGDEDERVQW